MQVMLKENIRSISLKFTSHNMRRLHCGLVIDNNIMVPLAFSDGNKYMTNTGFAHIQHLINDAFLRTVLIYEKIRGQPPYEYLSHTQLIKTFCHSNCYFFLYYCDHLYWLLVVAVVLKSRYPINTLRQSIGFWYQSMLCVHISTVGSFHPM